ncbi:MAG: four-carbon acid sugar kinase family protein [Firmicutes bacterium]|nr:four-carbon acid sugar kinase family protein [Bacillota bacterium]
MEKIVIIADDLTGACDTGIKFRNCDWETTVCVRAQICHNLDTVGSPVVSINTDTRSVTPEEAYETVSSTLKAIKGFGDCFYYKKVDSVLRGNIASELEACFHVLNAEFALIAPAFPTTNRRVLDGRLYIGAEDAPEAVVDAQAVVTAGSRRICRSVSLETIRSGPEAVIDRIRQLQEEGATLILADSWCNGDLRIVAQAAMHFGSRCIPVGSAGLARHLAVLLDDGSKPKSSAPKEHDFPKGALMVVVGTQHPATVEQVQRLKAEEPMDTYLLEVEGITPENVSQRVKDLLDTGRTAAENKGILLTTDRIYNDTDRCRHLLQANAHNCSILTAIGLAVKELSRRTPVRGIIATGGDVASRIFGQLHLDRIALMKEPSPGIVIGQAEGEDNMKVLIATKSGGFGDRDALLNLYRNMNAM